MVKKLLVGLLLGVGITLQAQAVVIACDPNATGSTTYPNVSCTSNGYVNVNATFTPSGTQNVAVTNSPTVFVVPTPGTLVDGSSTITTGGTSQQIFATNASRKYLFVQNLSTGNLYINFGSAATQGSGSILLLPNASFAMEASYTSTQTVNIIGATTGQAYTAKQQ